MQFSSPSGYFPGLSLPVFVASAAMVISLALSPGHVIAHSGYDHSTPGEDQVVATAPAKIDV